MKLTGGDTSSYTTDPERRAGSILTWHVACEVNLYYSELSGNKAIIGGAIMAQDGSKRAVVNIYNSVLKNNEVPLVNGNGGALYASRVIMKIQDSVIDGNTATHGGALTSAVK